MTELHHHDQRAEPLAPLGATRIMLYRNYLSYRSAWYIFLSGFLEPVFYLFSIGVGVGKLIESFEFHGETIGYAAFVAPGDAGHLGDERRGARQHLQLLLQAEVHQALRPDPGHPDVDRATSPSASWPGACCAAASTPSASSA